MPGNKPWILTYPGAVFEDAGSLQVSWPSPLRREAFARLARMQDTVPAAGFRVLVSQHNGGCDEWLSDNTPTGGGSQSKPLKNTWRVVCRARTELMAGCALVARAISVPSGATEYLDGDGLDWLNDGNGGAAKFSINYANVDGQTDSKTVHFELAASAEPDGVETATPGAAWSQLQHHVAPIVRPDAAVDNLEETAKWSEFPTVSVDVSHRGGARVLHATLSEIPYEHVVAHNVSGTTYNGQPKSLAMVDRFPVEKTADGATYEDNRFGVHRVLHVAARQRQRVGARIFHWSAWSEKSAGVTDTEADAVQVTSTTPVRLSQGTNTTWDPDAPGFDCPPSKRAPENLRSRLSGAAQAPWRVRVYCRFASAGSEFGFFKVQTSPRSWVTIKISQATVGTTWQWVTATELLETNVASDDTYCSGQDFVWVSDAGEPLEVRDFDVSYGDYEVAV